MSETVVVGGGVIGLTSAYLLAKQGVSVTVIDQQQIGQEASWAGAGMLPPVLRAGPESLKAITKQSAAKWPELSQELLSRTGIDNGYRNCGAIQISLENPEELGEDAVLWNRAGAPTVQLDSLGFHLYEQAISPEITSAFRLPTMSQVRNPRHLKALKEACVSYGVKFIENQTVRQFEIDRNNVKTAVLENRKISADSFVISTGAWTEDLLKDLDLQLEIIPIRGQIVLMKLPAPLITHIIEDGPRYLVPREDGNVLIGSTEENVGFVKETTDNGVQGLIDFALQVVPQLSEAKVVKSWSGLRPKAVRGYPLIGQSEALSNLTIAAGHFRDGLLQSPVTAQLVAELVTGQPTSIDLAPLNTFNGNIFQLS